MASFQDFAADLAFACTLETGWPWTVDGETLCLPPRHLRINLSALWEEFGTLGAPAPAIARHVLAALRAAPPQSEALRLHVIHTPPPDGALHQRLAPHVWGTVVADLPLTTVPVTAGGPAANTVWDQAVRQTVRPADALFAEHGTVVAFYQGDDAEDAAVAYGLAGPGALVALLDRGAVVLPEHTPQVGATLAADLAAWAAARHRPVPTVWLFQRGVLAQVITSASEEVPRDS